jgi:hypothetical protein
LRSARGSLSVPLTLQPLTPLPLTLAVSAEAASTMQRAGGQRKLPAKSRMSPTLADGGSRRVHQHRCRSCWGARAP